MFCKKHVSENSDLSKTATTKHEQVTNDTNSSLAMMIEVPHAQIFRLISSITNHISLL